MLNLSNAAHSNKVRKQAINPRILEPLEARALFSAAIQLSGDSTLIANNDNTPSLADFTDFFLMSTTPNADVGAIHRQYTITNTGNADLTLTGAGPVTLSGAGAHDFSVAVQPATTIGSGNTTTFTINFVPKAAGARNAKVTIHSNDPAHKTFSFSITGLGVMTTNDSSNGLQYATTAQINTHLASNSLKGSAGDYFDDTGVLTDGTVVFTSANIQDTPVQLQVDDNGNITGTIINAPTTSNATIAGWLQGLQGIQIGETRALVVPAALAFGNDTTSGMLANEPILFTVTCKPPTLGVTGNLNVQPTRIVPGDATPSADDGTFIGTIPGGATVNSLSSTFELAQAGNGLLNLATTNPLSISGKDASAFSVSFLPTTSSFAGITVTYQPTKAGTQSAVITVRSTDPVNPAFSFTVSGTSSPFLDITAGVGTVKFPKSGTLTAGAAAKYTFPVDVLNSGNSIIPANSSALDIQIYLHNTTTDALTLISPNTLNSTTFRSLAAGKSKTLNVSLTIPAGVAPGTYDIQVIVDHSDVLPEATLLNNTGTSSQLITVV